MRRITRGLLLVVVIGAACSVTSLPAGAGAATADVAAAKPRCTGKPFVGTVRREAEESPTGQPAAERTGADFESALVYSFGNRKNFTVYLADTKLKASALGGTLEAPDGGVLVTTFLRKADGKDLRKGTKLVPGRDPVSVIVDAGAGAQAVTGNPAGTVEVLAVTADRVCFAIRYDDGLQHVNGVVDAEIP